MLPLQSAQNISLAVRGCRCLAALLPLRFWVLAIHPSVSDYAYSFCLFQLEILSVIVI